MQPAQPEPPSHARRSTCPMATSRTPTRIASRSPPSCAAPSRDPPYWQGRHPDHTSRHGLRSCFVSGLAKVETPGEPNPPHRPFKILYASLYADVRPTFVVDITPAMSRNLRVSAYGNASLFPKKRFANAPSPRRALRLLAVRLRRPFVQKELVEDTCCLLSRLVSGLSSRRPGALPHKLHHSSVT